jgi:hypothetical protein
MAAALSFSPTKSKVMRAYWKLSEKADGPETGVDQTTPSSENSISELTVTEPAEDNCSSVQVRFSIRLLKTSP